MTADRYPPHDPIAILAGIGLADRPALATLIALFEEAAAASLLKAAAKGLWGKVAALKGSAAPAVQTDALAVARETILASPASDEELRHRLWLELITALNVLGPVPFSPRSARQSASALAVRVSERLSPALRNARELTKTKLDKEARSDQEPD